MKADTEKGYAPDLESTYLHLVASLRINDNHMKFSIVALSRVKCTLLPCPVSGESYTWVSAQGSIPFIQMVKSLVTQFLRLIWFPHNTHHYRPISCLPGYSLRDRLISRQWHNISSIPIVLWHNSSDASIIDFSLLYCSLGLKECRDPYILPLQNCYSRKAQMLPWVRK